MIFVNKSKILKYDTPTDSVGYFFEVSLSGPEYLHEYHNDMILAPYNRDVSYSNLSPRKVEEFLKNQC